MPVSTKKVTKSAARKGTRSLSTAEAVRKAAKDAALTKAIAKNVAKNVAKRAAKPAKTGKAKPAATKPVPAPKAATASAKPAATGAKAKIIAMIDAIKGGVSAAEIAKTLSWPRAGGTISRAIKLAPFKVAKARDAEGVLRYSRA